MSNEQFVSRPEPLRGYRTLSDGEKALIDQIKLMEQSVGDLWREVQRTPGTDGRMLALAKTGLQDAFMWWVRSVTKPRDVFVGEEDSGN
jgi:hypothetical protein